MSPCGTIGHRNVAQLFTQLGYLAAPVVVAGAAAWAGFQPDKIKAIASARATNRYTVPVDPMDELQCDNCQSRRTS